MICYFDRTFCKFYKECTEGRTCRKALTKKIKDGAKKAELPIMEYTSKPSCFKEISKIKD